MEVFDYIMAILLLLLLVLVIIKFRNIRKAKIKVIITRLNKKSAVIVALGLLFMIALFVLSSVLFEADVTGFLEIFYCILIVLEVNFGCVTPDGIIGEDIKNNGLIPKENYSYRYTFKGMFQTEQLELYMNGAKKPNIYRGNIRNPELVKMLEENYKEYVTEDKSVHNQIIKE